MVSHLSRNKTRLSTLSQVHSFVFNQGQIYSARLPLLISSTLLEISVVGFPQLLCIPCLEVKLNTRYRNVRSHLHHSWPSRSSFLSPEIRLELHMESEPLGRCFFAKERSSSRLSLFHAAAICCGMNESSSWSKGAVGVTFLNDYSFGLCASTQNRQRRFEPAPCEGSSIIVEYSGSQYSRCM